ncbi:MAG TPA: zinc ribbon domain-containing protein [Blastocatellia bacterium]|nr:zinc ribbon domain-containing protein [Blastocatellia bacterium]
MASGFEHHFRRTIPGDIDSVRQRLSDVLEGFGYIVIGDAPIQAKRKREKSIWVSMVLDYEVTLTIALKPISSASTLATFEYAIEQLFTRGEMQALEREAEAIIALATSSSVEVFCASCGAENAGNTRFCRVCGKPAARNQLPPELEVMRLTANASGSQIELTIGLILSFLALTIAIPIILFVPAMKGVVFGWILLALGLLLGGYHLNLGMRRLHKLLNPVNPPQLETHSEGPRVLSTQDRPALPPQPVSIVEGTTELMTPQQAPLTARPARNTDSME